MEDKLTLKAQKLMKILMKLKLPKEKVLGMMAMLQTDEQIDELCAWVKEHPAQLTMEWKKNLIAATVTITIAVGEVIN